MWIVLGIKASGHYIKQVAVTIRPVAVIIRPVALTIRQVAVTYRRGTSVVRNFKFLTPSLYSQLLSLLTNVTIPTQVVGTNKLLYVTNTN